MADRGYDHDKHRRLVRQRGITLVIVRRKTEHGSGLGTVRWVVERTFAWLHHFKRLLVRYNRRHEIHHAFLAIGCCLICYRRLDNSFGFEFLGRAANTPGAGGAKPFGVYDIAFADGPFVYDLFVFGPKRAPSTRVN